MKLFVNQRDFAVVTAANRKRIMQRLRAGVLASACFVALTTPAHTTGDCPAEDCETARGGRVARISATGVVKREPNQEVSRGETDGALFSISVDGEHVAGTESPADADRIADKGLDSVDVQVKFDGLELKPFLNVSTNPTRSAYRAGETVTFRASSNYAAWVDHAEIRIIPAESKGDQRPFAVVPAPANGEAEWTMPEGGDGKFIYVLRVYDAKGRFDETHARGLSRTEREPSDKEKAPAPGYGEDYTAKRNIALTGGAVTVFGRNVPPGYRVDVLGESVPVDDNQSFVIQKILPAGDQEVNVALTGGKSGGIEFTRQINIPENDWFYVALADVTVGRRMGDAGFEAVRPGEFPGMYKKGRFAFYLKGKIKGKYLLTAAADTGEGDLASLFKGFDGKDARSLLRRLDPDDYYPIYGDDSSSVEDAPTRGKFYVRLERGDSHVMWGNYNTSITGTEFMRQERALYGAEAVYKSQATTPFGERRIEVRGYAAQPGTLPHRDIFQGTGGSVYFLKHQDITPGSERLSIEIIDPITGLVVERRQLALGVDYEIDSLQGVIMLKRPLSSVTGGSEPVTDGALGGHRVHLVAQYEYTPAAGDVDGYVYGGRAQAWLGDHVRVGATAMSETTGAADQRAFGVDVQIRHTDKTYVEAEWARSSGPGFGSTFSADGGISNTPTGTSGVAGLTADVWRVRAQIGLEDITGGKVKGAIGAYYTERQRGFSTLAENVTVDARIWGANVDAMISENVKLALSYDDYADADGKIKQSGEASAEFTYGEHWAVILGVDHTRLADPLATKPGYNGRRTDIGARVEYRKDDDNLYYVFGQATVARSGDIRRNDRVGVGADVKLTEKIGATAEVSYGTTGIGALAAVTYEPTADDRYYLGYRLDPDRIYDPAADYSGLGADKGVIVAGARRKIGDTLSLFAENQFDVFSSKRSLTQAYGVVYTPSAMWSIDGNIEIGRITDNSIDPVTGLERSDFDRKAFSASVGYNNEERKLTARLRGEFRMERSEDGTRDLNAILIAAQASWQQSKDWRLAARFEAAFSDRLTTTNLDGTYVEASVGYAYRPVAHDRFNALFKYTFLYDLPGAEQVNVNGELNGPAQRSHILSADMIYDVTPWLSVGAKYGFRIGDQRARSATAWTRSDVHLGILRADFHIVKEWDATLEGRVLWSPVSGTVDYGALAAVYKHVGENFKIGLGYNFGRFSDDLRDLTLDDQGVFFNLVGKF